FLSERTQPDDTRQRSGSQLGRRCGRLARRRTVDRGCGAGAAGPDQFQRAGQPRHRKAQRRACAAEGRYMNRTMQDTLSKVPEVTLVFWIIKIAATTLGETGGDAVTMTMGLGYLIGTAIFGAVLLVAVGALISAKRFHPFLYWFVIVATTTTGTTMADFLDRSLGIGYIGGSSILLASVLAVLGLWHWSLGSVSVDTVTEP